MTSEDSANSAEPDKKTKTRRRIGIIGIVVLAVTVILALANRVLYAMDMDPIRLLVEALGAMLNSNK
jgi:hypothetical protein